MDREAHVCPVCGQPVDTVVGRHKTLGAWVPVWKAGPCRNPGCESYGETSAPAAPTAEEAEPEPDPDGPVAKRS
ncbi:hypothetical protein OIB37_24550 [Streptomyces sp. NBC_00820]|uniref:hypothetical protein n=1 Tax=Streptomyces sp. NBC_00820 TaxID=2975842 RepID=UPI002ED38878|nr:hypothetical protein OIB37_24550 [Streptomyces sp. NBC_00820]